MAVNSLICTYVLLSIHPLMLQAS